MGNSALQHPKFFNRYVNNLPEGNLSDLFHQSYVDLQLDLTQLKEVDFTYAYQSEKWTIAQLLRHCIDTEIIFGYRALCIARKDPNPIMSFDENVFASNSVSDFQKDDLIEAMLVARQQNLLLFKSFDPQWLNRNNRTISGDNMSLVSVGYIIIGHWMHHKKILAERYGVKFE